MFCQFCEIHNIESDAEAPNANGRIHELATDGEGDSAWRFISMRKILREPKNNQENANLCRCRFVV